MKKKNPFFAVGICNVPDDATNIVSCGRKSCAEDQCS